MNTRTLRAARALNPDIAWHDHDGAAVAATAFVHPTARLDTGVIVMHGAWIGQQARVSREAIIGVGAHVGDNVIIGVGAHLETASTIQDGASVPAGSVVHVMETVAAKRPTAPRGMAAAACLILVTAFTGVASAAVTAPVTTPAACSDKTAFAAVRATGRVNQAATTGRPSLRIVTAAIDRADDLVDLIDDDTPACQSVARKLTAALGRHRRVTRQWETTGRPAQPAARAGWEASIRLTAQARAKVTPTTTQVTVLWSTRADITPPPGWVPGTAPWETTAYRDVTLAPTGCGNTDGDNTGINPLDCSAGFGALVCPVVAVGQRVTVRVTLTNGFTVPAICR